VRRGAFTGTALLSKPYESSILRVSVQLLVLMESLKAHSAVASSCTGCPSGRVWTLPFVAEARDVATLRGALRLPLDLWGLSEVVEDAQLCVSELVANVIQHVGPGTPATLVLSAKGAGLRIEVHDPDLRALPTLAAAGPEAEVGRGMALIDALADRWGVDLTPERKATWCELGTGVGPADEGSPSRVEAALEEETVIGVVVDLLHRLRLHGWNPDEVLDQAQIRFEADTGGRWA
jgi:anti-sigma regulatory factor (Ser/Thr protein kinase)